MITVSAVWVYSPPSPSVVDNIRLINSQLKASGAPLGINRIYLSLGTDPSGLLTDHAPIIARFVTYARANGIATYALTLEDPSFASEAAGYDAPDGGAVGIVQDVIDYNLGQGGKATFEGIHIDTEPVNINSPNPPPLDYLDPLGTGQSGYLGLLGAASTLLNQKQNAGANLEFSAAIEYWWLTNGYATLNQLSPPLDELVPMFQTKPPEPVIPTDSITARYDPAKFVTVPTVIGIGTFDCGATPGDLAAAMNTLANDPNLVAAGQDYLGTSVYAYEEIVPLPLFSLGGLPPLPPNVILAIEEIDKWLSGIPLQRP